MSSIEETDFFKMNQSLYSTTFIAYGGRGQFCSACTMPDHMRDECALSKLKEMREPGKRCSGGHQSAAGDEKRGCAIDGMRAGVYASHTPHLNMCAQCVVVSTGR